MVGSWASDVVEKLDLKRWRGTGGGWARHQRRGERGWIGSHQPSPDLCGTLHTHLSPWPWASFCKLGTALPCQSYPEH